MNAPQAPFIGQSVTRREDARFLTGRGQYTDDITLDGQTYGDFLRSPHAHARIKKLDTAAAAKAPGVLGIFTGEHFKQVGGLPCGWLINSLDGTPMKEPQAPGAGRRQGALRGRPRRAGGGRDAASRPRPRWR